MELMTSITAEPIEFYILGKIKDGPGIVLGYFICSSLSIRFFKAIKLNLFYHQYTRGALASRDLKG